MSAKTGSAPTRRTALAVAAKVKDGTITSSPGPIPSASSERWSAEVPELTATQCAAGTGGELLLEGLHLGTLHDHAAAQHPYRSSYLFLHDHPPSGPDNPSLLLDNRRSTPGHAPEYVTASTCTGVGRIEPEDIEPMICRSQGAAEYSVSRAPPAAQCAGGG